MKKINVVVVVVSELSSYSALKFVVVVIVFALFWSKTNLTITLLDVQFHKLLGWPATTYGFITHLWSGNTLAIAIVQLLRCHHSFQIILFLCCVDKVLNEHSIFFEAARLSFLMWGKILKHAYLKIKYGISFQTIDLSLITVLALWLSWTQNVH